MKKINTTKLVTKAAGLGAGAALTGVIQKAAATVLGKHNSPVMMGLALLGAGLLLPDMLGKKNEMITHAGDAVAANGIATILRTVAPNIVSGLDSISGSDDDDNIAGAADLADVRVSESFEEEPVGDPNLQ